MELAYSKLRSYYPDIERLRPAPSEMERQLARLARPPALPLHCKPWLDAARYGFLLRYPYEATLRVRGVADAPPHFSYDEQGTTARAGGLSVSAFASSHFSLRSGYRFRTPEPVCLMTTPLPALTAPPAVQGLTPVRGIVETWWYPRPLFVVFENPAPGEELVIHSGDPLCALVPVLSEDLAAREMTTAEAEELVEEDERYKRDSAELPGMAWTSLEGVGFSHRYKAFSKRARS
jgi:hypothetical protein